MSSNQESVMVAEADQEQALSSGTEDLANDDVCLAELMNIITEDKDIQTLIQEIDNNEKSILRLYPTRP
jgi:hypothetical protein